MIERIKEWIGGSKFGWSGNYRTWQEASSLCSNYDDRLILNKVRDALLEVKNGKAAFERDSVLFDTPDYNWPFLAAALWAFAKEDKKLNIIDFGGSLGSTYFQHRTWFEIFNFTWNVVEQTHFVEEGKRNFETNNLKFLNTVEEVIPGDSTFLILSSVLAYLRDPYEWLSKLLNMKYDYIFIDRTPLIQGEERLTIQKVPKEIYDASYPAWFFNKSRFLKHLNEDYRIIAEHDCAEKAGFPAEFRGFFLALKNSTKKQHTENKS